MYFSLADLASKTGMARSSIYRLISEGKLSATVDRHGKKVVELTEALRHFGELQDSKDSSRQNNQKDTSNNPVRTSGNTRQDNQDTFLAVVREVEQLRAQLQLKAMELQLKDKEISFTKERLDEVKKSSEQIQQEKTQLLQIIERQTLLLAAPKPQQAPSKARRELAKPATKTRTVKASTPAKTAAKQATSKVAAKPAPKLSVKTKPATAKKPTKKSPEPITKSRKKQ